ncbi:MAG: peptidoglycan DD-metalloendopeptidase family protein [Bacteroidales bacterium]|nr:peptidoglycan DD-metalloendopeptidase family protein [Bacteroidales bacterium]
MRKLAVICLLLMGWCLSASAQNNLQKLKNQQAQLEKDIAALNRNLAQNAKNKDATLNNLKLLQGKIVAREKLIAGCDQTILILNDSIGRCQSKLMQLQARHDTLTLYYKRLVRGAYKSRDSRLWYMYILASESVGQGLRRAGYLREMSAQLNSQALQIRETAAQVEAEKERLHELRKESEAMRLKVNGERNQLKKEESDANHLIAQLNQDQQKYEQQLKEKNRQKEALNKKIEELIRKEAKKGSGKKKGKSTSTAIDTKLSNEFAANKGRLPWPVEGTVIESFGKHNHPVYTNVEMPENKGVTISVARGAKAKAVFNGKVTQVVVVPGFNQCVLVSHGAYFTLYCRLKGITVKAGEKVTTGQVLGTVDTIGGEDIFHFELWKMDAPQNPENWLKD